VGKQTNGQTDRIMVSQSSLSFSRNRPIRNKVWWCVLGSNYSLAGSGYCLLGI